MSTLFELQEKIAKWVPVRKQCWPKECYITFDTELGYFVDETGEDQEVSFETVFDEDWEEFDKESITKPDWRQKMFQEYSYFDCEGVVHKCQWFGADIDERLWSSYNCFKTEKEAKNALRQWLAERELHVLSDGGRWIICDDNKKGFYACELTEPSMAYRFSTKEKAERAIKILGTEKLRLISTWYREKLKGK